MSTLRTYIGIDLGSTTTKAVVLNDAGEVIGRGITNSRSNYDVACQVVREEALVRTRFTLTRQGHRRRSGPGCRSRRPFLSSLERNFRFRQHLDQLAASAGSPASSRRRSSPQRSSRTN